MQKFTRETPIWKAQGKRRKKYDKRRKERQQKMFPGKFRIKSEDNALLSTLPNIKLATFTGILKWITLIKRLKTRTRESLKIISKLKSTQLKFMKLALHRSGGGYRRRNIEGEGAS